MGSGGARARSGPAPDPNALRRERDAGEWTLLPATGRPGDPPEWPLPDQSERELELWTALWPKPQALMWERLGLEIEVALYVRRLAEAEAPGSPANLSTLVRQMSDSLGLTTPGLRANRWKIEAPKPTAVERVARAASEPESAGRPSARERLTVVRGEGS